MNRIVTISFTPLDAPGGVPKFNRDIHSAFSDRECMHFSWWDFPWSIEMEHLPEWEKARTLNHYLIQSKKLNEGDVIIADGFWADGLQHMRNAISHSHGIWSHLTKDDVDSGRHPENPFHHAAQVAFRQRWTSLEKHITAVSDFIADQMKLQWGFTSRVINNGVDTDEFCPSELKVPSSRPVIVHGVNDRGNVNKGWDHIELLKRELDAEVHSLDDLMLRWKFEGQTKAKTLAGATICVHPSGYEGNSMFVAEAMACGLPIVGYNVGYLYIYGEPGSAVFGKVIDRKQRSPEETLDACRFVLSLPKEELDECSRTSRLLAPSMLEFVSEWREYVEEIEK